MSRGLAFRRHHRERKIKNYFKREYNARNQSYPHHYFAYDLTNEEDFLEFLSLSDFELQPKSGKKIYIIGRGCINESTYVCPFTQQEKKYYSFPYDNEEVIKRLMDEAKRTANTPACCSNICCTNPRRIFGKKTKQEYHSYYYFRDEMKKLGINLPRMRKSTFLY